MAAIDNQPLKIKQEDIKSKNSKHLSKEISKVESSFRVLYYGGASGAIPFLWESQPGTPKDKFSDSSLLPPLTPPPSYQFTPTFRKNSNPNSKRRFLYSILKMGSKKSNVSRSFSSSSSSGSSTYSATSVIDQRRRWRSHERSRSVVQYEVDEDEEQRSPRASPNWTLCFASVRDGGSRRVQGGRVVKIVKKALWAVLGHRRS